MVQGVTQKQLKSLAPSGSSILHRGWLETSWKRPCLRGTQTRMGSREACSLLFLWEFVSQETFSPEWHLAFVEGVRFIKWIAKGTQTRVL